MSKQTAVKKGEPEVVDDQVTDDKVTSEDAAEVDAKQEVDTELPQLEVVKKATPVTASRMNLEVESNTTYRVNVTHETTPEDCMDEAFWAHVSMQFIIGDTIIVIPDSMEWKLVLHVANCGREFAHMVKLEIYNLRVDPSVRAAASRYSTDYAGTTSKWRFKRDGVVMRDGYATENLAKRAADNHQMAVDRAK